MTETGGVLRIADLRRACSLLLEVAETRFGGQISLSDHGLDYYWNVDLGAAFAMDERPELQIDCGQISADLAELASLLQRHPEDVVSLWHDVQHVVGLLRLVAYLDLPGIREHREG